MPSEKRARQKAARQKKRAAQARRERTRRHLRNGGLLAGGAAIVLIVVLFTQGVFSSSPSSSTANKKKSTTSTTKTTTATKTTAATQTAANKLAVAAGCHSSTTARTNTLTWATPPAMSIDTADTYTATVKTTAGTFSVKLDAKTAPTTVNNFVFLADQGYYNCNVFQRVIPGFMDQTGDPTGTGSGGPGYEFANENVPSKYATGDVAMANSGGTDTNGSQFFIVVPGGATTLDSDLANGDKYSLFGQVTAGMDVVEKINALGGSTTTGKPKVTERILKVTIHES